MSLNKNISYVYSELEKDLETQIKNGLLRPGECILSENELSHKYGVSRRSSRKAVSNLVEKQLLYRLPGKGTFVSDLVLEASPQDKPGVSFIIPDIDDIFISEICRGIQKAADSSGCSLIIQSSNGSIGKENENIEFALRQHIDGAIIFPNWGRANIDAIYKLKERGTPFVLIDRYFRDVDTDYVVVDNKNGAFVATQHLIKLGHRKIAHLYGTEGSANDDRLEGYRDALAAAGIVYRPEFVKRTEGDLTVFDGDRFEPDKKGGYENMNDLLSLKDPPTAVFAGNDYQAIGAIQAVKDAGLKIPGDVAVVGFDDLKFSELLETPLTTVRQPKDRIGEEAFKILIDKIRGRASDKCKHIVLDTELVIRKSCGAN
jgi:GntR family transcriptional regulator of arabinose operon